MNGADERRGADDPAVRSRALTFTFVGGGFAGIEAFAVLEDMARYAVRKYKQIEQDELRFVLVETVDAVFAAALVYPDTAQGARSGAVLAPQAESAMPVLRA